MKALIKLTTLIAAIILLENPYCYAMNPQNTAACMGQCPYCSFSTTSSQALAEHIKTHINTSENAEIPEPPKKKQNMQKSEDSSSPMMAIKEEPIDDETSQSSPIDYNAIIAEAYKYATQPDNTTTSNREKSTTSTDNAAGPIFSALSPMRPSDISEQESFSAIPEKPYKCDQCDKAFAYKSYLTIHMRTHTRERPYKCDQCGKAFTRKSSLTDHMRTHAGERPYKCDTCGKTFTQKTHLTIHMRTHTREKPYKCDQCGKAFTQKGSLTDHMRTHTGERPYKCDTCGKAFAYRSNLTEHMRIHTKKASNQPTNNIASLAKMAIPFLLNQEPPLPTTSHATDNSYTCPICNSVIDGLANFLEHKKAHPTSNNL